MFGGFILHFLLCNYLAVLLKKSYEEPVETVEDLINRDITPFLGPGREIFRQVFAASPDPNYQELSRRLVIAKDYYEFFDMVRKVESTGLFSQIGYLPYAMPYQYKDWYRSTEVVGGLNPYGVHLSNKKWPLKKVTSFSCQALVPSPVPLNLDPNPKQSQIQIQVQLGLGVTL